MDDPPEGQLKGAVSAAMRLEAGRRTPVERLIVYEPPLRWAEQGDPTDVVGRVCALTDEGQPEEAAELFFREEGRLDDEGMANPKKLPVWEPMVTHSTATATGPI